MEKIMTKKLLIARAEEEQRAFRHYLEESTRETVANFAREYVLREDILRCLSDDNLLDTIQAFALLVSGSILSRITEHFLYFDEDDEADDFIRSCIIEEANKCVERIYDLIEG